MSCPIGGTSLLYNDFEGNHIKFLIAKFDCIFIQNNNLWPFWVSFCKFALLGKQFFLSQLEINHVIQEPRANSQQPNTRGHVDHLWYKHLRNLSNQDRSGSHCLLPFEAFEFLTKHLWNWKLSLERWVFFSYFTKYLMQALSF